ncbi:MAG: prohibitin family protein [Candidatus Ornithomonoglobus sp.]
MRKRIVAAIIVAILIIGGIASCKTIPAGETGVVTKFGAVSDNVLSEGIHFTAPFITKVVKMDNRVVRTDVDVNSASKDLQTVSSTISVNYRLDTSKSADVYKNIGTDYENVIVRPAVQETTKTVIAKFTAEEPITNRQIVSEQMSEALGQKISPYGLSIQEFNILNFDFSEEFNKAIEAKQTAQQEALKAEQDLQRVKVEAEQKIVEAQAEAEKYRLQNQEITDKTLALKYLEKWNGKLPTVTTDGNQILDIGELLQQ